MNKPVEPIICSAAPIDATPITFGADNALPAEIELMPVGEFRLRIHTGKPGPQQAVLADPEAVIRQSLGMAAGGVIPIDFDHGMDGGGTRSGKAAGWITGMKQVGQRLVASVEWTASGRAALEGRDYRFISPTFYVGSAKEVTCIVRAGLTNYPALPELKILASTQENDIMPQWLQDLAVKLGMPNETDEAKITAAASAAIDQASFATSIVTAAGLTGPLTETASTAIVAKITASANDVTPDPAKFVPITALTEVTDQLAALQTQVNGGAAERLVASAMADGKLSPAMKTWGEDYAAKDADGFKAWCAAAPKIVNGDGGTLLSAVPDINDGELTADEKMVCSAMGVSEEAFIATKQGKPLPAPKAEG